MKAIIPIPPQARQALFVVLALLCLSGVLSSPFALLLGLLLAMLVGNLWPEVARLASSKLLKVAVVGLGFGLSIDSAWQATSQGFSIIVLSILFTLLLGTLIGRWLRVSFSTSYLISVGTAICGGSAIAAVAPTIKSPARDMSVALAVVFLLNAVALFTFPAVGRWLQMSQADFGLWAAIAIHDTSSVVGAGLAYGAEALQVATSTKLARALWILPVGLLSLWLAKNNQQRVSIPWFIFIFIGVVVANSYIDFKAAPVLYLGAKRLLVLTLFLIGSGLSIQKLKAAGVKPFLLGSALWVSISLFSLLIILLR